MLYVAYGSNMNLEQMAYRCPNSIRVGTGILKNYKLMFKYHADIEEREGSEVPVVIWDIHPDDWNNLDRYEGYPTYYLRKTVTVTLNDGTEENAVVYYMNPESNTTIECPSLSYYETCYQGYADNKIDTSPIEKAYTESRQGLYDYCDYCGCRIKVGDPCYEIVDGRTFCVKCCTYTEETK